MITDVAHAGTLALLCACGDAGGLDGGGADASTEAGETIGTTGLATGNATADGTGAGPGGTDDGGPDFPPPGPPGGEACPGLSCLPCGNGEQCAAGGPTLGDSCCAEGDALVHRGTGAAAEAVDVQIADGMAFLCGGFGVRINRIDSADDIVSLGGAAERCQHTATGPAVDGGTIFWLTHHGDTWVAMPMLATYRVDPTGVAGIELIDTIEDPEILFEGGVHRDGVLYVAAHDRGVLIYEVGPDYAPIASGVVGGFTNATNVAVDGDVLYVADGAGGVRLLSLADPLAPAHLPSIVTGGLARDVAVANDRLAIALGGGGVDVWDVEDPSRPTQRGHIEVPGSVQSVDVDERVIAVAAWNHVALYDRSSLVLLATERVRPTPEFEQDVSIALDDQGLTHVAEWEGHHVLEYQPGLVAPDIFVEGELMAFAGEEPSSKVVVVRNRGYLDLDIHEIAASSVAFEPEISWVRVPALGARAFEVAYQPPANGGSMLVLSSNDPDSQQNPLQVPLSTNASNSIDVGDTLTPAFGFLSPTGQLDGLEGNVIVLAYFALF